MYLQILLFFCCIIVFCYDFVFEIKWLLIELIHITKRQHYY